MAATTFTLGRDGQGVLVAPNGTRVDLSLVTNFRHTMKWKKVRAEPLNGPPIERSVPDGHELQFDLDRKDGAIEALAKQIEAGWWSVGSADSGTGATGSVTFYIAETNGSQTTHQFLGASFEFDGAGDWKPDVAVKQTIKMYAQTWK